MGLRYGMLPQFSVYGSCEGGSSDTRAVRHTRPCLAIADDHSPSMGSMETPQSQKTEKSAAYDEEVSPYWALTSDQEGSQLIQ